MGDMVSRDKRSETSTGTPPEMVFTTWRRMLTSALALVSCCTRAIAARVRIVFAALVDTIARARSGSAPARMRLAVSSSIIAIATGVVLNAILAAPQDRVSSVAAALVAAAWVIARFPAMRIAASRVGKTGDMAIAPAWAAGALLQFAALTPELRFITWALGALLSWRTLRSAGYTAREAGLVAGVGYGLEAVGFALLVLLRSLRVAVLLLGGGV